MKFYRIACLLVFFVLPVSLWSRQDSVLQLSQQQWRAISEGVDYSENFKEPAPEKQEGSARAVTSSPGFSLGGFKYVLYVLVFALIVFLTSRAFGNFKANPAAKEPTVSIDVMHEIEENMHEINLEDLLQKALSVKNYGVALRLNFLIIIKLLSQRGQINWAKEKTNWEYYTELHDRLLADQFKELIIGFEAFWYGEHPLTELQYHHTEPSYRAMQKQLTPNE